MSLNGYEFRTTFAPQLSMIDITKIATRIHGAASYVLQQYRPPGLSMDMFGLVDSPQPHSEKYICETALLVRKFVAHCSVRGLQRELEHVAQSPSAVEKNIAQSPSAVKNNVAQSPPAVEKNVAQSPSAVEKNVAQSPPAVV